MLSKRADRRAYPVLVGGLAFLATLSMSVPVVPLLSASVLLNARRWRTIALCAAVGSGTAALVLYVAFHHLGWVQLLEYFPELTRSAKWARIARLAEDYGLVALLAIAASPLPQTPALVVVALAKFSRLAVFAAIFSGKLAKYGLAAWLAARAHDSLQGEMEQLVSEKMPHGRRHDTA
ncbi:hypothetical protein CupriaWKF_22765 [Cupriavidus sp. WKF15]|uniref:YqaA family protein n=1 Tax=Cupriavidus sp. WKF15 TaxID=3032282 RepID=UPI0023E0E33F|nr:hypothetical protein [Cupriavidus sp. WKF15]WER49934.1 hypothetical protein CupriaWKF_22765 [Cupriavidus sp. WKF15]